MIAKKQIGQRTLRVEDPPLIKGLGRYVDDIKLPKTLHVVFLRSMYAHARLRSIDVSEARRAPGVVAIYTGQDLAHEIGLVPCGFSMPDLNVPDYHVLATNKVCFVGHPIAAVVATDPYVARDAIDLVMVDYEDLPAVTEVEEAVEGGPIVHENYGDNISFRITIGSGDVEAALALADRVIKQRLVNQRVAPLAMEPRGVLAQYSAGRDELTVWSSTQIPHILRTNLAKMLGLSENMVRVIAPEVGGGFGSKVNVYAEEAVVGWIAWHLGQPVKWIESRRENLQSTIHGRGQVGYVELGCRNDGTLTGLRYNVLVDLGAYQQMYTPVMPMTTALMMSGCYKIPAVQTNVTGVFTNKVPTDSYRGAGGPEATYAVERAIDMIAAELGLDPVAVRRKNFPDPIEFPFQTATGVVYDSGNYDGALQKALDRLDYQQQRQQQEAARAEGRLMGIGISTYVELCGVGPSAGSPTELGCWESATVRVSPSGAVTVLTGVSPVGQGQETSFAQIVSDHLGVDLGSVRVIHGDTAKVQYGIGTFGSRATAVGGTAVYEAVQRVKQKARLLAAHLLGEENHDNVAFEGGTFYRQDEPDRKIGFREVAHAAHSARSLPAGAEPGLDATYFFDPENFTTTFGAHLAVVEIDRETGEVRLLRYIAVDDCGTVINPLLVEGQIHGGVMQSIGQALYEEVVYDGQGQLLTGTLLDYAVPKATLAPWFEVDRTVTPSPVNPLGVKGVGEAGTIAATPAIVNAIVDALSPYGVRHLDMPVKAEVLWRIIEIGAES